jgi:hypothetical protein
VVDVDDVDGGDGRVGVGVGGEQRPPGAREQVHRRLEELDAAHLRHPVVGEEDGHLLTAKLELPQRFERLGARGRPQHPVVLAVATAQVAGHRTGHRRVVVDAEQHRPARLVRRAGPGAVRRGGGGLGHGWAYDGTPASSKDTSSA